MKKSEIYHMAMLSVIEDCRLEASTKLKIVEQLMNDRNLAKWSEEQQEKKEREEQEW